MNYANSLLLYEDEPAPGNLLKLIFLTVPAALMVTAVYLWSSGESSGGLTLLAEALVISLIFWAVLPRSYRVYEDHIRIVLGGPFTIKVGFDRLKKVEVTRRSTLSVNFTTTVSKTCVIIVQNRGLNIAITPKNNELFADSASRALSQWAKSKTSERF